ncbi:hypothetical protein Aperf_G00000061379 [Anoplocephala perfoliata]
MKTRSTPEEPPNIAAGVKARRTARMGSPSSRINNEGQTDEGSNSQPGIPTITEKVEESAPKPRQGPKVPLRELWTADDRRLFFQGVRLYGRNYREIARFIQSRGHRVDTAAGNSGNQPSTTVETSGSAAKPNSTIVVAPVAAAAGLLPNNLPNQVIPQLAAEGRTKAQVRMFYQQTWHKLRRYITFPEEVPLHVREVYAIVNWSAMRGRIKKALDNRLGEKLNELVQIGSTCIKHHGRRFLLRTPICPILKQLNNISAPTQNFTLPDDVVIELVPATQLVAWRVLEAEQNPRLRLIVDINRQLSDVISIVEVKWTPQSELIRRGLGSNKQQNPGERKRVSEMLRLRLEKDHRLDGAISVQEVSRTRSTDISLTAFVNRIKATAVPTSAPVTTTNAVTSSSRAPTEDQTYVSWPHSANVSGDWELTTSYGWKWLAIFTSWSMRELRANKVLDEDGVEALRYKASAESFDGNQLAPPSDTPNTSSSAVRPTRAGNPSVRLDLREIGKQLFNGVTYIEARAIKLVVVYLALGCPERIRFEYDYVNTDFANPEKGVSNSLNPTFTTALSREAIANGEGMTNGLRRLLHLSASEYLNLKNFNQPIRPATKVGEVDDLKKTAGVSKSSAKQTTKSSTSEPGPSTIPEFVPPAAPVYGLVCYGEGVGPKLKEGALQHWCLERFLGTFLIEGVSLREVSGVATALHVSTFEDRLIRTTTRSA